MTDIQVTKLANGRVALITPYHPEIPAGAKNIGGRWDGTNRCWTFNSRDEDRVRALAREVFGTDGSAADQADLVTVRVAAGETRAPKGGSAELRYFGRLIATRSGRDQGVRLGDGVILISGGFAGSAGSMTYPELGTLDGTVVEIRDVPRAALAGFEDDVTVVGESVDIDALLAEQAKLEARLAEIQQTLTAHGHVSADTTEQPPAKAVPAAHGSGQVITLTIPVTSSVAGISTADYAAHANRSPRTIRRWAATGRIPATRTPLGWVITA